MPRVITTYDDDLIIRLVKRAEPYGGVLTFLTMMVRADLVHHMSHHVGEVKLRWIDSDHMHMRMDLGPFWETFRPPTRINAKVHEPEALVVYSAQRLLQRGIPIVDFGREERTWVVGMASSKKALVCGLHEDCLEDEGLAAACWEQRWE